MIRLGLLGAGGIASAHLQAAAVYRGARVVHVADRRLPVARALADRFAIARVSRDPGAVLADPDVEAVIVALPTHLHEEWIARSARAGKDILTEKPLCRTTGEALRVIRTCDRCGVRLAVGYMRRFSPAHRLIRDIVRSGGLGRPITWWVVLHSGRSDGYRGPGNWMWKRSQGGGAMMDGSIHAFDFAVWVLGAPTSVHAVSQRVSPVVTAPTQASAVVHFRGGDHLVYACILQEPLCGPETSVLRIMGPRGTIVLESDFAFQWHAADGRSLRRSWERRTLKPGLDNWVWLFYRQLDSFVRRRDKSLVTGEEALRSLWIAERIVDAGTAAPSRRYRLG